MQNEKSQYEKHQLLSIHFFVLTVNFALVASYITILVTDFFGFSVVITNIYLFLIPAFVFILNKQIHADNAYPTSKNIQQNKQNPIYIWQYMVSCFLFILASYAIFILFQYRDADIAYALGNNYDKAGYYQVARPYLQKAVEERADEPVFRDELSINDAVLTTSLVKAKDMTNATKLGQEAIQLSEDVISHHPNNLVFWKTRIRLFYSLATVDAQYLQPALDAAEKAHALAPTDAKISYNLGLLYGQTNQTDKAIGILQQTIVLKPDYRDPYYALGLMYHEAAIDSKGNVVKPEMQQKAVAAMHFILNNFSKDDTDANAILKKWGAQK